jgi:transglutaminase-like putative cysteine protease
MHVGTFARRFAGAVMSLLALGLFAGGAHALEPDEVRAIVRNPATAEDYPGAPGVWLALDRRVEITGTGRIHGFDHVIARVFDPAWGREQFSPYVRTYFNEYQSVTIFRARIWRSPDKYEDLPAEAVSHRPSAIAEGVPAYHKLVDVVVDFPELEPGSTIEILIEFTEITRPGEMNIRSFEFVYGAEEPVIEHGLHLALPSAANPAVETMGTVYSQPKRMGAHRYFDWLTGNLSPLSHPLENGLVSHSPSPGSALPDTTRATVFGWVVWDYLSRYYGRSWQASIGEGDPEITIGIGAIVEGATNTEERIDRVERWVQQEVRTLPLSHQLLGFTPIPPGEIYRSRAGSPCDKAALLVTMLAAVGVRGEPVLVRTRTGPWRRDVAAPEQLDRWMLRVRRADGSERWCDPLESESALPASEGLYIIIEDESIYGLVPFPGREAQAPEN